MVWKFVNILPGKYRLNINIESTSIRRISSSLYYHQQNYDIEAKISMEKNKSIIENLNKISSSIEPCGTPEIISLWSLVVEIKLSGAVFMGKQGKP